MALVVVVDHHSMQAELDHLLKHYVGRETPLYYAERLSQYFRQYVKHCAYIVFICWYHQA